MAMIRLAIIQILLNPEKFLAVCIIIITGMLFDGNKSALRQALSLE
jgi:hypothetical protein